MRRSRPLSIWGICLAFSVGFGLPAVAVTEQAVLDAWNAKLARVAELVRSGSFEEARKLTIRLTDDLVRRLGRGRGAALLLARASAFRALSESGLGNVEDAVWYWDVARAVSSEIGPSDLASFGSIAEPLVHVADAPSGCCPGDLEPKGSAEVEPPRALKRPQPKFPRGAAAFGIKGQIVVQAIIDERGRVTRAMVVEALDAPSLTYATLEALRHWSFEPARLGGEPVEVYYNLTVDYHLRK